MQNIDKKPESKSSGQVEMLSPLTCLHFHQLRIWLECSDLNGSLTWITVVGNSRNRHPQKHKSTGLQAVKSPPHFTNNSSVLLLITQLVYTKFHIFLESMKSPVHSPTNSALHGKEPILTAILHGKCFMSQKSKAVAIKSANNPFLNNCIWIWQLIWLFKQNGDFSRKVFFFFSKLTFC